VLAIVDGNLNCTWYSLGDNPIKQIFTGASGTIDAAALAALPAGAVTIHFFANDTVGNQASADVTVVKQAATGGSPLVAYVAIAGGAGALIAIGVGVSAKKKRSRQFSSS
jgi:hypothetical protein